jgi:hypothetical protein
MTTPTSRSRTVNGAELSIPDVQRLTAAQVAMPSRILHVLLLVVASMMGTAIASLWVTEPSLPMRTHIAFGLIVCSSAAWAAFAVWVLARRRVLFGIDRVVAATIALTVCAVGALGMTALGYRAHMGVGAYIAAATHAGLCGVAAVLLVRARRRVAVLARRKRELQDELDTRRPRG